ncbi:hypothetical protein NSZ01_10010 [Nocardioides szechwanensis]|nr:hypothetical protein NSZ01_10010 [Nocardioides szechwanensis]
MVPEQPGWVQAEPSAAAGPLDTAAAGAADAAEGDTAAAAEAPGAAAMPHTSQ